MQGMQLYWHLGEFFFQSAVTLITFIAAATVLWRNVGNNQQSPILTALSSGYMALLLYAVIRYVYPISAPRPRFSCGINFDSLSHIQLVGSRRSPFTFCSDAVCPMHR